MEGSKKENIYDKLNKISQKQFARANLFRHSTLNTQSTLWIDNVLEPALCDVFADQLRNEPIAFTVPELINKLLGIILTEELDRHLLSYFQSEYAIVAFTARNIPDTEQLSWQCNSESDQQLRLKLYIQSDNTEKNHGELLDINTTEQLKNSGYAFNNENIADGALEAFCQQQNINLAPITNNPIKKGMGLLFNPNTVAYQDTTLANHAVIEISFIPSPYHWKYVKDSILSVDKSHGDFSEQAKTLIEHATIKTPKQDVVTLFPPTSQITSAEQLRTLLICIFPNNNFAWEMFTQFIALDPDLKELNSLGELINTLKLSFQHSLNWSADGRIGTDNIENLMQLAEFEKRFDDSSTRYSTQNKPDPTAVFWPNPKPRKEDNRPPLSRYDQLPFVKRIPLVNKETPIGSAGSCFAQEIAKVFQQEEYNYIVTEKNDDPAAGMIVDNYQRGDKYAIACANYGILFNTPSFKQLAERAFGTKPTQKILFQRDDGLWLDPYRENVGFVHQQAYINDYQNHLDATRKALEQSEVFIITLGLNECWELHDGSYLSRNPQRLVYAMAKHRTLSVQENVDNIQAFFNTVRQYNPNFKLIITLSPIPFLATGHGGEQHVITANTHSKSVLRVAAQELVDNNEDMHYLPSYELVTQCIKDPWQDDDRHVTVDTVKQVVNLFKEMFVGE